MGAARAGYSLFRLSTPGRGDEMEFEPEEAVKILRDVMRGELDGRPVTTSERIRAASLLMRWYLAGDFMLDPDNDDLDPLSQAISDYKREAEDEPGEKA